MYNKDPPSLEELSYQSTRRKNIYEKERGNIMKKTYDDKRNASGCADPVAFEAISKVDNDSEKERKEVERFSKLMKTIYYICACAGFHIEDHITLKDTRTGRIWK